MQRTTTKKANWSVYFNAEERATLHDMAQASGRTPPTWCATC